jgi:hypothetical protein
MMAVEPNGQSWEHTNQAFERPAEPLRPRSLNFHDRMVAQGKKPSADGRIPLSDGAGEVIAVGEGARNANKICETLDCQPGDILEYRPDHARLRKVSA